MSEKANARLQGVCDKGLALLDKLSQPQDENKQKTVIFSPFHMANCKAVLMMWTWRAGVGIGLRRGSGICVAKLPSPPGQPVRWSAPLFLKLTMGEAGFVLGVERIETLMVAMSDKMPKKLATGSHVLLGLDSSMVALTPGQDDTSDAITFNSQSMDIVTSAIHNGLALDFSLAGGALSVDDAAAKEAYGVAASRAAILGGGVEPPEALAPLYARLSEMAAFSEALGPTRVGASLERMTAGYDPERRVVSSDNKVLHRGTSEAGVAGQVER